MPRGFLDGVADAMLAGEAKRAQSRACAAGYRADEAEKKLRRERARAVAMEKELVVLRMMIEYGVYAKTS